MYGSASERRDTLEYGFLQEKNSVQTIRTCKEDSTNYSVNQNIKAKAPAKTTVEVKGGKWVVLNLYFFLT